MFRCFSTRPNPVSLLTRCCSSQSPPVFKGHQRDLAHSQGSEPKSVSGIMQSRPIALTVPDIIYAFPQRALILILLCFDLGVCKFLTCRPNLYLPTGFPRFHSHVIILFHPLERDRTLYNRCTVLAQPGPLPWNPLRVPTICPYCHFWNPPL